MKYILNENLFDKKKGEEFEKFISIPVGASGNSRILNSVELDIYTRLGVISPVEEKEWPQVGDRYYFIYSDGGTGNYDKWGYQTPEDEWRKASNNIFRTEKEAIAYKQSLLNKDQIMGKGV